MEINVDARQKSHNDKEIFTKTKMDQIQIR